MKPISTIAVAIFVAVGVLHLMRLVLGFEVVVAGWSVPSWVSLVAALLAGALAVLLGREARKS